MLERGPRSRPRTSPTIFRSDLHAIVDEHPRDGVDVIAGNCVGGSSVIYFAASLGRRASSSSAPARSAAPVAGLDQPANARPLVPARRADAPSASRAGTTSPIPAGCGRGLRARGTHLQPRSGRRRPRPLHNCNWMSTAAASAPSAPCSSTTCRAEACGTTSAAHEVQSIAPASTSGYRYAVSYLVLDRTTTGGDGAHDRGKLVSWPPARWERRDPARSRRRSAACRPPSPLLLAQRRRVTLALLDEARSRDVLGLERAPGVPTKLRSASRSAR